MLVPAKPASSIPYTSKGDELPDFGAGALSTLTRKIESNLNKQISASTSRSSSKKAKINSDNPNTISKAFVEGNSTRPQSKTGILAKDKQKRAITSNSKQENKRSHDRTLKQNGFVRNGDDVNNIKLGERTEKSAVGDKLNLDKEIRFLGGTTDDLDLIADAPSDSEFDGGAAEEGRSSGDTISKEVYQLARQLGVDRAGLQKASGTSDSEWENDTQASVKESPNKEVSEAAQQQKNSLATNPQITRLKGKGLGSLLLQPRSEWHTSTLPQFSGKSRLGMALPLELLNRLQEHAKSLLENENKLYASLRISSSSEHQFYSTIMSTGTLSDKISALTLSIQESPLHNMKSLEALISLARKRSRGQAVEVLGALKDLFGPGNLLPADRKLKAFINQPGLSDAFESTEYEWTAKDPLPQGLERGHLVLCAFEDWLKTKFFEVLKVIEIWCNDEVVYARGKAVDYICQLLKEKPEQEANLLRLLVNKLGDSDKKVASKTSFNILQLENTHPLMKLTIISAIESDLLFRPGQSLHAKYYATITLNQTVLSRNEEGVAKRLLQIYFDLFVNILESKDASKASVRNANAVAINKNGEIQGGGGAAGKKAQKKLAEKEKGTAAEAELKEKMISAILTGVNRAIPFTSTKDDSFDKHLDTLFKVTHSSNFNTSIQALMLIEQLRDSSQSSVDRFYRTLYESLLDPRLLTSSKQALYLNLTFRALRSDLNIKRIKAFSKRLLQVVSMHQPSFTCGTIYLLRELEGIFANLKAFIDQPEEDDNDEENFQDVKETSNTEQPSDLNEPNGSSLSSKQHPSLKYDGRKRDPEYSNANHSSLWELTPFLLHYHPLVSLFANRLITHAPMPPKPDLSLNTLIHFLDRFVYRNPKKTNAPRGASIMQPMSGGDSSALLVSAYSDKEKAKQPVNTEAFWRQEAGNVSADEVFFHKYFNTLGKGKDKAKKKKADRKANAEGSESEGDEDEIWKALVESKPELDEASEEGFSNEDASGSDMEHGSPDEDDVDINDEEKNVDETSQKDDGGLDLEDEDEMILDSDDEVPSELDEAFKAEVKGGKKKPPAGDEGEKRGRKRRRLKNLPTFASVEDYAHLLGDAEDDFDTLS